MDISTRMDKAKGREIKGKARRAIAWPHYGAARAVL
jgi:hypothetical protein